MHAALLVVKAVGTVIVLAVTGGLLWHAVADGSWFGVLVTLVLSTVMLVGTWVPPLLRPWVLLGVEDRDVEPSRGDAGDGRRPKE